MSEPLPEVAIGQRWEYVGSISCPAGAYVVVSGDVLRPSFWTMQHEASGQRVCDVVLTGTEVARKAWTRLPSFTQIEENCMRMLLLTWGNALRLSYAEVQGILYDAWWIDMWNKEWLMTQYKQMFQQLRPY